MSVLVYSDNSDLAKEIAACSLELASQLDCGTLFVQLDELEDPIEITGKVVLLKADRRLSYKADLIVAALSNLASKMKPPVILIGATRLGRQVAAQMAVRMKVGALSEVRSLKVENMMLTGIKAVYGGRFTAKVSSSIPCVATIPTGAYQKNIGSPTSVETISVDGTPEKVVHIETRPKKKGSTDIKTASIIISAGRGFKKKEDLVLLEKLAKRLDGAVGCSRPISSDLGWMGEENHIGLTGAYVHPDLYVAVGISGQLQHIAGIRDSKIIIAINKDKQAPIFQIADYGIVGDLYEIIPALLKCLS